MPEPHAHDEERAAGLPERERTDEARRSAALPIKKWNFETGQYESVVAPPVDQVQSSVELDTNAQPI